MQINGNDVRGEGGGGRKALTAKRLPWMTSNHHILDPLSFLELNFDHVCSIEGFLTFLES